MFSPVLFLFVFLSSTFQAPLFHSNRTISFDPLTPSLDSAALPMFQFELEAHTESANALAEKLFYGRISQNEYDAQVYSATIASTDRAAPTPIIMTLDDTLAALLAYANRKFGIPLETAHLTKMYVLSSAEFNHAVGGRTSPGVLLLLEQDNLKMALMCLKQSPQMEQLFVEFDESNTTPLEGVEFTEDDTEVLEDQPSASKRVKSETGPSEFYTAHKD